MTRTVVAPLTLEEVARRPDSSRRGAPSITLAPCLCAAAVLGRLTSYGHRTFQSAAGHRRPGFGNGAADGLPHLIATADRLLAAILPPRRDLDRARANVLGVTSL